MTAVLIMLAITVVPPCIGALLVTIKAKLEHMAFDRVYRGDHDTHLRAEWTSGETAELHARLLKERAR